MKISTRTKAIFDCVGTYFINHIYSTLYEYSRAKAETDDISVTESFLRIVAKYKNGFPTKDNFRKQVSALHEYFCNEYSKKQLSFTQFEDMILEHIVPEDYYGDYSSDQKDKLLYSVLSKGVSLLCDHFMRNDILRLVIDKREYATVNHLQDKAIDIFAAIRKDYYQRFAKTQGWSGAAKHADNETSTPRKPVVQGAGKMRTVVATKPAVKQQSQTTRKEQHKETQSPLDLITAPAAQPIPRSQPSEKKVKALERALASVVKEKTELQQQLTRSLHYVVQLSQRVDEMQKHINALAKPKTQEWPAQKRTQSRARQQAPKVHVASPQQQKRPPPKRQPPAKRGHVSTGSKAQPMAMLVQDEPVEEPEQQYEQSDEESAEQADEPEQIVEETVEQADEPADEQVDDYQSDEEVAQAETTNRAVAYEVGDALDAPEYYDETEEQDDVESQYSGLSNDSLYEYAEEDDPGFG
jgi:hypothetical protein